MSYLARKEAANLALDIAKSHHCEADVIVTSSKDLSLKADKGELSEYKVTSSNVLGIRLLRDDKVSTSFTEALNSESISQAITMAIENLTFSEASPDEKIVSNHQLSTDNRDIYCADDVEENKKIELALRLESEIASKGAKAPYNAYADGESEVIYANSLGACGYHKERAYSCYTSALIEDNGTPSMGVKSTTARRFDLLDPQHCIDTAFEKANSLLKGEPVTTGNYAVIFEINCLAQLFSAFSLCLSGEAARRETNPWLAQLNKSVASPLINLTDYANYDNGFAIKSFDGEGMPTRDTNVIENGHLSTFLHNSKTASHFGVETTGNAARGAKSALGVSSRHKVIEAGSATQSDIESGVYFVPVELQGVHSGANAISGDFSFGASGFLYREGEQLQAVRGVTIAGNFYQMLREVDAVGDTILRSDGGTFFSPRIRFSHLSVAGS